MIFEIPIDVTKAIEDGDVTSDVDLDGSTYTLQLTYVDAAQLWFLTLSLHTGDVSSAIARGLAMVSRQPLLSEVQIDGRPAGELIVSGDIDAGRNDLGGSCKLLYYDAAEIAAL